MEIKIIEEKPLSMIDLKEELKDIKKRDEELGFRSAKVSEYLDTLKLMKQKDAEELFHKISKLGIPRLKDMHIIKIIDIVPMNINELKNITTGYALTITNENLEKVLELVKEYAPKK